MTSYTQNERWKAPSLKATILSRGIFKEGNQFLPRRSVSLGLRKVFIYGQVYRWMAPSNGNKGVSNSRHSKQETCALTAVPTTFFLSGLEDISFAQTRRAMMHCGYAARKFWLTRSLEAQNATQILRSLFCLLTAISNVHQVFIKQKEEKFFSWKWALKTLDYSSSIMC